MAKRKSNGVSAFNKWVGSIPREENFSIAMVADTTNEVWVDIDTNLLDGYAWALYGIEWFIQNPTTFEPITWYGPNAPNSLALQIHRNDDHELLIEYGDDDLWLHHHLDIMTLTSGAAIAQGPYRREKPSVTFGPTLRAVFRTDVDATNITAADLLVGKIYYDIIKAPTAAQTKLGYIAEM